MSIRPEFAHAIFDGSKDYEFRRVMFRDGAVNRVLVYVCKPVGRVLGEFSVEQRFSMAPTELWVLTRHAAGIDRSAFFNYFSGRTVGHALKIGARRRFARPLDLWEDLGLRRPPQSFQYVGSAAVTAAGI